MRVYLKNKIYDIRHKICDIRPVRHSCDLSAPWRKAGIQRNVCYFHAKLCRPCGMKVYLENSESKFIMSDIEYYVCP